jgi:hypothetical protein
MSKQSKCDREREGINVRGFWFGVAGFRVTCVVDVGLLR